MIPDPEMVDFPDYVQDKDAHIKALEFANEVLGKAQEVLTEGRKQLEAAIKHYKERSDDPRSP